MTELSDGDIKRHTVTLFLSGIGSSVLGFVRQFLVARFLDPQQFGVWNLVTVLLGYANYADVGLNTGLLFKAPMLRGAGQLQEAQKIREQTVAATWVLMGGLATVLFGVSWLPALEGNAGILRLLALAVIVFPMVNVFHVEARLRESFSLIGGSLLLSAAVALALTVLAPLITEQRLVEAAALAWLLGSFVAVAMFAVKLGIRWAWPLDWRMLWQLVQLGLPLALFSLVFVLFQSVDRWVLAPLVAPEELGHVALGATIGMFLYLLPSSLGVVISTRLLHMLGSTGDPRTGTKMMFFSLWVIAYGMAFVSSGLVVALPFLLEHVLPLYQGGLAVVAIVIISNCLLFPQAVAGVFLLAAGGKRTQFLILSVAVAVKVILIGGLGYIGGVLWAGGALLISNLLYALVISGVAVAMLGFGPRRVASSIAGFFLPFMLCSMAAYLVQGIGATSGSLWSEVGVLFLREIAFLAISVPLCLLFAWLSGGISDIRAMLLRADG